MNIEQKNIEQLKDRSDVQDLLFAVLIDIGEGKYDYDFLNSLGGDLSKLGMNSLTFIKLLVKIEKRFEVEIDFEIVPMETLNSLNEFSNYLYGHSPLFVTHSKRAP